MFKIGEFSKIAKTTVKTLRFYNEADLLKPSFVDENGYRYYETEQLNTLIAIMQLRKLDVPVAEVKKILTSPDKNKLLTKHLLFLEKEALKKQEQISLLKKMLASAEKGDFMEKYNAKKIIVPQNVVYYKHGVIPSMNKLFDFVLSAGKEAKANNPTLKCKNYVALVCDNPEKAGYTGEIIVLKAQKLGLNTCWVAMTYGKAKVKINKRKGEKIQCVIALGYGKTQGVKYKIKPEKK